MRNAISFLAEREKLQNNILTLRNTAARMSLLSWESETLYEECDFIHVDVLALKAQLNRFAQELGVQPLP
jgi:hypothetical protein